MLFFVGLFNDSNVDDFVPGKRAITQGVRSSKRLHSAQQHTVSELSRLIVLGESKDEGGAHENPGPSPKTNMFLVQHD